MKVKELIDKVNSSTDCFSLYDAEKFIEEKINKVASDVYVEKHKWYNISTNVYKLEDGFVGITGSSDLKSETMNWSDCDYMCIAEKYESVYKLIYQPKNLLHSVKSQTQKV